MSRSAQIIAGYTRGRSFSQDYSAEEYLAMAYDELLDAKRRSDADAAEARRQRDSTVHRLAMDVYAGRELNVTMTADPTVWRLELRPFRFETKMLTAAPSQWDPAILDAVITQFREHVTQAVAECLYKFRSAAKRKP